ncbi:iron-sulfur cofactor synthesis protein [Baffinella frigidus]|nr:iron-sulfur cofactor synthesis protein [Cryptophyta sp. CCMP2293]
MPRECCSRRLTVSAREDAPPMRLDDTRSTCADDAAVQRVIDHYETPLNVGSFDKKLAEVGTGLVGAPACGDVMKLQIKVKDGKIEEAVFKTFGCGSAIASSSLATEWVKGMSLDDAVKIKNTEIASHLNLPPVKLHCSMLAEDAIKAAVKDYKAKVEAQAVQA